MFGLTKREQQQAAWEREAALVVPAIVDIAKAALQADTRTEPDCRTCGHYQSCAGNDIRHHVQCINAGRYEPLPPVKLWRTA